MKPVDRLFTIRRKIMRLPSGNWQIAVTPPPMMRMPTQLVELTPTQMMGYNQWQHLGVLIQEALPDLTPSQREILMTGIGDEAFHEMTHEEEFDERESKS
jgi:hypothetical protein